MTIDTENWTIVDLVRRQAKAHGEREFMSFEHGTRLTFASLDRDSDTLACNRATLGVVSGDRVIAVLNNRIEFMLAMIAVQELGAIFVPINTELKGAFLQHQLRNSEPRVLFLDHHLRDAFDNVAGGNENLTATIYVAGEVPAERPTVLENADAMTFEGLAALEGADDNVLVSPRPEDIAFIMCTSGTTCPAKGVLIPHAYGYTFGYDMVQALEMTEADCQYVCLPIFHRGGLLMQVVGTLIAGARTHCVEKFSPIAGLTKCGHAGRPSPMHSASCRRCCSGHRRPNTTATTGCASSSPYPSRRNGAKRWKNASASGSCRLSAGRKPVQTAAQY